MLPRRLHHLIARLALAWFGAAWWAGSRLAGAAGASFVGLAMLGLLALLLPLGLGAGKSFQFLNLSSIQNLYSSRLVRAYLGASNPARANLQDPRWARLSDTHPGDNLPLSTYHAAAAAPLHLINVTVNETVSPEDPLVQRDRHGRPLCVTPAHLCVDGDFFPRHDGHVPPRPRLVDRMKSWVGLTGPVPPQPESMSLGSWVGISGAAFSTGIGRGTTLGKALLLGLANVRLGHWWDAGPLAATSSRDGAERVMQRLASAFRTQSHLLAELSGRFSGRYARYWYLSDGGHFDNTGVYELLRRRIGMVVCADNGADPNYQHEDVANLMRMARIDFGCEFRKIEAQELVGSHGEGPRWARLLIDPVWAVPPPTLEPVVPPPSARPRESPPRGGFDEPGCLSVYWVSYPGSSEGTVLVVVKPRLVSGAPVDVQQYARRCPAFPQESTVDQFFSEEQWESYRRLAELIGAAVAGPEVAGTLEGARARWLGLRDAVRSIASGTTSPGATVGAALTEPA